MNCKNHLKIEATGSCVNCGNLFCENCLVKAKNKNYCKDCASELVGGKKESQKNTIIMQQQQQQTTPNTNFESKMETNWNLTNILKWIIGLFTILFSFGAFSRTGQFRIIGFLILLILGLYWIPPIQDKVTKFLNEKYKLTIPRWARILASVFLFFFAIMIS